MNVLVCTTDDGIESWTDVPDEVMTRVRDCLIMQHKDIITLNVPLMSMMPTLEAFRENVDIHSEFDNG